METKDVDVQFEIPWTVILFNQYIILYLQFKSNGTRY